MAELQQTEEQFKFTEFLSSIAKHETKYEAGSYSMAQFRQIAHSLERQAIKLVDGPIKTGFLADIIFAEILSLQRRHGIEPCADMHLVDEEES
jgi:hypothetical protein